MPHSELHKAKRPQGWPQEGWKGLSIIEIEVEKPQKVARRCKVPQDGSEDIAKDMDDTNFS